MKKNYVKPSMQVFEMKGKPQLLDGSPGGGMLYIPAIPGQPDDEKQLA